ncbi:MFS transporter [Flavobacterium algicola]|uniref:MFS transporter n=1 Tax=Flavobacterium algicola TaxID=556529 RepID=UPI001EFE9881|nr:MFS transporter [Flavobacterium algicola]MCG9791746.1 MFS transporter [Flavobacterium algicola]
MNVIKAKIGNYRFRILALLLFATTINYFDRSIIGVMAPTLQKLFNWSNNDYANILISFQAAYAIGMLTMGGIIDRLGTKIGYTVSIGIWSAFGMLHALVTPAFSIIGFSLARFGLGFGEAGNFPAAIKTVAEWFPKKERAYATGIFNAATSLGAIAAPFVVGWIVEEDGTNWQIPFLITGALSTIWIIIWLSTYKKPEVHPKVSPEELAHINSDSEVETDTVKIPWIKIIKKRQAWAFAIAKTTDAVWWFYLFWGAKFLSDTFDLKLKDIGLPFFIMYFMADIGSIFGGYLSGYFINKGWSINKSRKVTLLLCALLILPVSYVAFAENKWVAVFLIGIGAAGHQAWSANIFTLVPDVFPKKAIATIIGLGGMVGAVASIISNKILGSLLDNADNTAYFWAFLVAGSCYLVVLGFIQLLMPSMTPLNDDLQEIR